MKSAAGKVLAALPACGQSHPLPAKSVNNNPPHQSYNARFFWHERYAPYARASSYV